MYCDVWQIVVIESSNSTYWFPKTKCVILRKRKWQLNLIFILLDIIVEHEYGAHTYLDWLIAVLRHVSSSSAIFLTRTLQQTIDQTLEDTKMGLWPHGKEHIKQYCVNKMRNTNITLSTIKYQNRRKRYIDTPNTQIYHRSMIMWMIIVLSVNIIIFHS
jgi:hypothetical protein